MEQIILEVSSSKDAALIKELLTHFKSVEVNTFSPSLSSKQIRKRIATGLKEADEGKGMPWKDVKKSLVKKLKDQ